MIDTLIAQEKEESSPKTRSGRELIHASLVYAKENRYKSWLYTIIYLLLPVLTMTGGIISQSIILKAVLAIFSGLLLVKFFVIYHDYQHGAILQKSILAKWIMKIYGIFILAPSTIWKRSHDHHHNHNSKLSNSGIGSYPLLAKKDFLNLTNREKSLYLIARHPITIFCGYISLFLFDFNIKTFIRNPKTHWDSLAALIVHGVVYYFLYTYFDIQTILLGWTLPFIIANGLGSYLFYAQHNFPGATFKTNNQWQYTRAAIESTSFLKMSRLMNWFTGNIGYHHVHHLNHHIPFYRLKEAMDGIPEMQNPIITTLHPKDIIACLRLKVWDPEKGQMTPLK